jgi:ketosteroid isomerase-like protein
MKSLQRTLAAVAIAFVVPVSAQSVDPSLLSGVDRIIAIYTEGFQKQDASPVAGVFTVDGVLLSQSPVDAVNSGTQAIAQRYEGLFKLGANNISITRSQLTQLGNDVAIALGEYQVTGQGQSGPIKIDGDWSATPIALPSCSRASARSLLAFRRCHEFPNNARNAARVAFGASLNEDPGLSR